MNRAVASETVTSECGSMKIRNATSYAAVPATALAVAPSATAAAGAADATRETTRYPSWPTARPASVHVATPPAALRPEPRSPQRGR